MKTILDNFLNNGIVEEVDQNTLRKIRYIRASNLLLFIAISTFTLIQIISGNYVLQQFIPQSLLSLVLLYFLFWYRKKVIINTITTFYQLFILSILLYILVVYGKHLTVYTFALIYPMMAMLLGDQKDGLLWSIIGGFGVLVSLTINSFYTTTSDPLAFIMNALIIASAYIIVTLISRQYEVYRLEAEKGFMEKNQQLQQLIYVISHDLRSPLTSLKGFIEFLQDDVDANDTEQAMHDLKRSKQVITSMDTMINEFLGISRIGRDVTTDEEFKSSEVIKNILIEYESQFKIAGISIKTEGVMPTLYTNKRKFEEVVRNLISNAIKYIGEKPNPTITVGSVENAFDNEFTIRDTGIGIPKDKIDKIFEMFYQQSKAAKKSTGVGLTITKGFVNDMGGKIWVEAEEGVGSVFHFTIPKKKVDPNEEDQSVPKPGTGNTKTASPVLSSAS